MLEKKKQIAEWDMQYDPYILKTDTTLHIFLWISRSMENRVKVYILYTVRDEE